MPWAGEIWKKFYPRLGVLVRFVASYGGTRSVALADHTPEASKQSQIDVKHLVLAQNTIYDQHGIRFFSLATELGLN